MTTKTEAKVRPGFYFWIFFAAAWVNHIMLRHFYEPDHPARGLTGVMLVLYVVGLAVAWRRYR